MAAMIEESSPPFVFAASNEFAILVGLILCFVLAVLEGGLVVVVVVVVVDVVVEFM